MESLSQVNQVGIASPAGDGAGTVDDPTYTNYLKQLQKDFNEATKDQKLFLAGFSKDFLYNLFLERIPVTRRQHYQCRCCRDFVNNFGGVVIINEDGKLRSPIWTWTNAPLELQFAIQSIARDIEQCSVVAQFYHSGKLWGRGPTPDPKKGITWSHMSITPLAHQVFTSPLQTADQMIAESRHHFETLRNSLHEFTEDHLRTAINILSSDQVQNSEAVLGQAKWLLSLKGILGPGRTANQNKLWLAVSQVPDGWCHIKANMIGSLLEDIRSGMDIITIVERFNSKMNPLQYQRPQAAPKEGNIKRAEEIVEKLGIARSLERRYARFEEVPKIWVPQPVLAPPAEAGGGVFDHLKIKGQQERKTQLVPSSTKTLEKFLNSLTGIQSIKLYLEASRMAFGAFATAVYPDAPPIIQWDLPEARNPLSWYVTSGGDYPSSWNLNSGNWAKVVGISPLPSNENHKHVSTGFAFILEGCKPAGPAQSCLFPVILKGDLREVSSTIEAHSKAMPMAGREGASACGIIFQVDTEKKMTLQVETEMGVSEVVIDRWE